MSNVTDAISDEIMGGLLQGDTVPIDGFGELSVRVYPAYAAANPRTGAKVHVPEKKQPFFRASRELRAYIDGEGCAHSRTFRAPALVARVARRHRLDEAEVARVLSSALGEITTALKESRQWRPLGRVGAFQSRIKRVTTGAHGASAERMVVTFRHSHQLQELLNGRDASALVPGTDLAKMLRAYPVDGFSSFAQVCPVLDRLGFRRGESDRLAEIEQEVGKLPDLLRRILASYEIKPDQALPAWLLPSRGLYREELRDHRAYMREIGEEPGIPFAKEGNGDAWAFCASHPLESDAWVFMAGPDADSRHVHHLKLSQWLAASLLVAELGDLAGDRFLSGKEVGEVLDRLSRIAPGGVADTLFGSLPY